MTIRANYAGYLIKKGAYYYRPQWSGYTISKLDAGRYTLDQAQSEQRIEPDNFTIEVAPEMETDGVGKEIIRLLRRGG